MPDTQKKTSSAGRIPDPDFVAIDLTYRCNYSCDFCFLENSCRRVSRGGELGTKELKAFIDSLAGRRREFYIAGGEPALRGDLTEIVAHIVKGGHRCLITTNGSRLDGAAVNALLRAGVDEITMSVHGTREMHDRLTGKPGAFDAAAGAAARINGSPLKKNARLTLWCTINRANHARLYEVYKALKALGPDHIAFNHMDYITKTDRAKSAAIFRDELGSPLGLKPSERLAAGISARALAAQVRKIKAEKDPGVRFDLDLSPAEMALWYDPSAEFRKKGFCLAQWKGLWVGPKGELLSCQPLGHVMGNIKDGLAAFGGPGYARFRKTLVRHGGFLPTCSRCGRTSYSTARGRFLCAAPKERP